TVGRERERSRRRKLPFPVGELVPGSLGSQLLTLPPSVIDVLDREVRQHRFGSGGLCPVDFSNLPDEDAQGMAVTHDLVRDEEQDVLVRVELEDRGAEQRAAFQVDGAARLVAEKLLDVTRVGTTSRIRDVDDRDTDRKRR